MQKKSSFNFTDAQESIGFVMWKTASIWQKNLNQLLSKYSLTHAQFVVLSVLYFKSLTPVEVTQQMIADFAGMDKEFVSVLCTNLSKRKLLIRKSNKLDKRKLVLILTTATKKILPKAIRDVEAFDAKYFKNTSDNLSLLQHLQKLFD